MEAWKSLFLRVEKVDWEELVHGEALKGGFLFLLRLYRRPATECLGEEGEGLAVSWGATC